MIFKLASGAVSLCYSGARVCFACVELARIAFTRRELMLLLLCFTLSASAASKPEPLTYKLGGRRYVIALPEKQLWSVSEVAQAASGHASGTLFIDGKEVRQARVRGQAGDRIGRNYLVVIMRTGKRLTPEPRYMVRPDPFISRPLPPSPPKSSALSPRKATTAFSLSAPVSLRLAWDNVSGGQPGGWGAGPEIMPDGGTRFWTVYSSTNLSSWTFCDTVTTNSFQFESINTPALFFRVHWRDEGAPAWRYQ